MDVQTLTPVAAQVAPPDASGGNSAQGGTSAPLSVQALSIPQAGAPAVDDTGKNAPTLKLPQEIAKVFTGGLSSNVTVSFEVVHNPNEIVTVFKNSQTGEVITQVPSEIMIRMAEFFDQVAGVVLDKSA